MKLIDTIAFLLTVVGGLNWGLIAVLNVNLVAMIFGAGSMIENVVYILVGLSALYLLVTTLPKLGK